MKRPFVVVGLVAAIGALVVVAGLAMADRPGSKGDDSHASTTSESGATATAAFFSSYVSADGRVVRHDQGGDTVSEGQAYAMLLAVATNDRARFSTVWSWTRQHLQRPDGLFSWRWRDGRVDDVNPASDADLDIAAALLLASSTFGDQTLAAEARRIATAVIEHETVQVAGRLILVAGPWAIADRVVNPSYLARCDFDEFEKATSDPRWTQLRTSSFEIIGALVEQGLPPDWVVVEDNATGRPIENPEVRQGAGRYGLDAARIPARLAECDEGRRVAAAMWPRLQVLERDGAAVAYATDGRRLADDEHPLGLVAAALAADAAEDMAEANRRMEAAQRLEDRHSTYYGSAWLALGTTILAANDGGSRVPRAAPRVGALRFAALAASAQAPTISPTTPPTASTTASSTTRPPTATSAPTTSNATSQPSTTRIAPTTGRPSTVPPTTRGAPTTSSTTAPVAGASSGEPPEPKDEAGDLSSPPTGLPALEGRDRPQSVAGPTEQERSRRRTGALTIGGFSAVAVLGAWLGLRERRIIRHRPTGAPEASHL